MIDQYLKRKWHIFPCKGKIPKTPNGCKDATIDPEIIKQYFRNPSNVGVATGGISGFFVLDIDVKEGAQGDISLRELTDKHGKLPKTVQVNTWSGGLHYYFKIPEGVTIGNRTNILPGIDIRGNGGYVIAPPSIINGQAYKWVTACSPSETDIADAPAWLLKLVVSDKVKPKEDAPASEVQSIRAGGRNDALTREAGKLRRLNVSYDSILTVVKELNQARCSPPLSDAEVETIVKSVCKYDPASNIYKEPYTDVWNAKLMAEKFGDDIRYCDQLGGWYVWDGTRWQKDESYKIVNFARLTIKQMFEMANTQNDKELFKHSVKSEAESKINAMIKLCRSCDGIYVKSKEFDAAPTNYIVNCKNGMVNLKTGELLPHDRKFLITKRIDVNYNSEAKCSEWLKFLETVFCAKRDVIDFIQRAVGYSLTADTTEQCMFILHGVGANGKSTFLKHISNICGDYAKNMPASALLEKAGDQTNDIAMLKGSRFCQASESSRNKKLSEALVKILTGGDLISARFLHKEFFEFYSTFKVYMATNHIPRIEGTDNGIWRRIRLIPFDKVFSKDEMDRKIDERLEREYEGILAWAIEGCQKWLKEGLGTAGIMTEALAELREESDIIGNFIEEKCVCKAYCTVSLAALTKEIQVWTLENGTRKVYRSELIDYLKKRGFENERKTTKVGGGKGRFFWHGIGLKTEFPEAENEADYVPY